MRNQKQRSFFWTILATLILTTSLSSTTISAQSAPGIGSLVKGSGSTVYYLGDDGGRYYFPNSKIFFTWYDNFDSVQKITDGELANYPLKGNVNYRAGKRLIKIESDPKVYACDTGGRLRWVPSEATAIQHFGSNWAKQVDDIPVSFFTDYQIAESIGEGAGASYNPTAVAESTPTITDNIQKRKEYRGEQSSTTPVDPANDPLYQGGGGSGGSSSGGSQGDSNQSDSTPSASCGNGSREGSEQCDGGDLNAESCSTRGFLSGTLSCSSSCTFVTSACSSVVEEEDPSPGLDVTAPSVSWSSPSSGATVSGSITLTATASDAVGVSSVKFQIGNTLITTNTSSPYTTSYDTTVVANGSHTLYAVAKDAAGNYATSTRSITVSNSTPDVTAPSVSFTAPSSGATVSGSTTITATATDAVGVSSVKFQIGSTVITTDSSSPYSTTYNTTAVSNGSYTLYAVAKDAANNYATTTRSITVSNGGGGSGGEGADCGSTNSSTPCTGTEISTIVDGITFTWNVTCSGGDCQMGRFLDGSPWVRHASGGNVSINSITPDDAASGLEKNPATGSNATTRTQGLYTAAGSGEAPYSASLDLSDDLPYLAAPDNGVYVKAKAYTGGDCGYTSAVGSNCIDTYTALVVLQNLPSDGALGAETFRPGAAGATKTFITIDDLDLTRLPQLSQITPTNYEDTVDRWMSPYPDFYSGILGDPGRRWTPHARLGTMDYAASRAERNLQDTFGVLSNDTLTTSKKEAVYALTQYGIELYSAYMEGVEWAGGAGQNQGRWHPIVFFGTLVTDTGIQQNIREATSSDDQFTELYQIRRSVNGTPIWGSYPGDDGCSQGSYGGHGRYWADYAGSVLRGDDGKRTCGDPYGYIDGAAERPGSTYATCCSSGVYISMGLLMNIWPEFDNVANNDVMTEFAERIMDGAGWWTSGDQCAIIDPREATDCSPYTSSSAASSCDYFGVTWGYNSGTGSCVTIAQATSAGHPSPGPRWSTSSYHLQGRPSLDRDLPGSTYWDIFN